ncbi:hypothetical protein HY969_03890 [Candidatus Kaiserbacteria bacterium]|nr:hypothetical protein [Candidatus Kaiserbacteria bacterium]
MLREVLERIGLSSREATVYLACLKLGTQDIKTLSKETKISPATVSIILTNLLDRGFVSKFAREKDFFTPEQPTVLVKILENSKFKLEEGILHFKKHLPHFEDYMNPSFTKPEIAFYEGKAGMIAAYEDTLTSKTPILALTSIDKTESILSDYVPKYYKRRKAANIPIKAIFPDSKMARARQKKDKDELRTSRLLPQAMLNIEIETNIYEDKVAFFSIPETLAVIVKSKLIAESMRQMFNLSWNMAQFYDAQHEDLGEIALPAKKKKA